MSRRAAITALSAVILCTLTACVTNNSSATCTVEGAKYLEGNASPSQICRSFEKRLDKALEVAGEESGAEGVNIAIELHQRGSAEAQVTRQGDDGVIEYPVVSVDVMDRVYKQKDLDKLADSVAQLLIGK